MIDYQSFSSTKNTARLLNSTRMIHQLKAKASSSTSDLLNEKQNERFFESNTLYKKELKKKQRDILSTPNNLVMNYQNLEANSHQMGSPTQPQDHHGNYGRDR